MIIWMFPSSLIDKAFSFNSDTLLILFILGLSQGYKYSLSNIKLL